MTAKEFIKKRENEVEDLCENWSKSYWAFVMEQYTIEITEQAVEKGLLVPVYSNSMFKIKQLTEQK